MTQVEHLLRAKIHCIWIDSYEESEVIKDLKEILSTRVVGPNLQLWSHTEGLRKMPLTNAEQPEATNKHLMHPRALFDYIKQTQEDQSNNQNIFVLRDFHLLNDTHEVKRSIRDIKEYPSKNYNPIIVISPVINIPIEHEKLFTVVNYDVPSKLDIERVVNAMSRNIERAIEKGKEYFAPTRDEQRQLIDACVGLTQNEMSDVFAKSLIKYKKLSLQAIMEEKIQLVKKSGVLDYVIPGFTMDDIGGNQAYKDWVLEVRESFGEEAQAFGVSRPKGYMAVGIPGCSKTAGAEAFANMMGWPLLVLSMSKVMDKLVGQSEKKIAQAFRVAKACAPCVMLWDEVEKMLGGIKSSNSSDSGTTARVFAECLNFLNSDNGVFVIMTSNDVSQLPPEFTRSGRLDAQWYFSLPTMDERKEIFKIHFGKTGRTVEDTLVDSAARAAENYTGAEIKEVVKVAMRKAYSRFKQDGNRDLTEVDVTSAVGDVIPLYKSSQEKILALEAYARGRARNTNYTEKNSLDSNVDDAQLLGILQLGG
jgi:SpoVK/Ycf46/Vps4 family AAA+-type ATPase